MSRTHVLVPLLCAVAALTLGAGPWSSGLPGDRDPRAAEPVPVSMAGVIRLDDVVHDARVEREQELALTQQDLLVHSIEAAQSAQDFQPASGRMFRRSNAEITPIETGVRVSGGRLATCRVALPELPAQDVGMVVLRLRSHHTERVTLTLQAQGGTRPDLSVVQAMTQGFAAGGSRATLAVPDDGEVHTVARRLAQFGVPPDSALVSLSITVGGDADDAHLDIESIHFLDSRAPYVALAADATVVERAGVRRTGLYLHTDTRLVYPVQVPEGGRVVTEVGALTAASWQARILVEADGEPTLLQERAVTGADTATLVADLSAWAGRRVDLILEAVADGTPTVGFFFHPVVSSADAASRRNVLWYLCDTLRADALHCNGNDRTTTPFLDQLAEQGVRFERCFSQAPWTYSSVPSILTSLAPTANGVVGFGDRLPESALTVAEVFREAGYLTAALVVNPLIGRTTNTAQGFDLFVDPTVVMDSPDTWAQPGSPRLKEKALELLKDLPDVPVFLYLHAVDVHGPYRPPEPYDRLYLDPEEAEAFAKDMKRANGSDVTPVIVSTGDRMKRQGIDLEAFAHRGRALYDAELNYFDANLRELFAGMDECSDGAPWILTFQSDHGEEFLEHGGTGHGQSLHDELIHTPWILHAPGLLPGGQVIRQNVQNLDIAPTILSLAGLEVPFPMQGRDLTPALLGDQPLPRGGIYSERHGFAGGGTPGGQGRSFSVIEGALKIIAHYDGRGDRDEPDRVEVFDLIRDPGERTNVREDHQDRAEQALRRLASHRRQQQEVRASLGESGESTIGADAAALQALGYVR